MSQVALPITAGTNQSFSITLPVDGNNVTLLLALTWNDEGGYWWLTVTDASGAVLLDGLPVITGQYPAANILRQYQYLGIGSAYLIPNSSTLPDNPTFANLGTSTTAGLQTFTLVWSDSSLT